MVFIKNFALLAAFVSACAGQIVNPKLSVTSTIEFKGINKTIGDIVSSGNIQGSTLSRSCLLLVRQKGNYQVNGQSFSVTFGDYEGNGATTAANFKQFGIPDGALIDPILDVSASSDIDLDVWFTADSTSSCVAIYTCSGSIFGYTYTLKGVTC
ncbi:hypothetical protein HGRIS_004080 [Hohenbuehelia grisea]|uniref:Uncharacterized protein n=1 Tax=Hohenbuehelia grisea TaxID=104357 RepID=A0ABR3JIE4_9AGAR